MWNNLSVAARLTISIWGIIFAFIASCFISWMLVLAIIIVLALIYGTYVMLSVWEDEAKANAEVKKRRGY